MVIEYGPNSERPSLNPSEKVPSLSLAFFDALLRTADALYSRMQAGDDKHLSIFDGQCRVYRNSARCIQGILKGGPPNFGLLGVHDPEMQSLAGFPPPPPTEKKELEKLGRKERMRRAADGYREGRERGGKFQTNVPCALQVSNRQITITAPTNHVACTYKDMEGFVWSPSGDFAVLKTHLDVPFIGAQVVDHFLTMKVALSVFLGICIYNNDLDKFYNEVGSAYLSELRKYAE
jgi:hypothetical protein